MCNGASTASIDLTVSGGSPTYTAAWTGPSSYTASTEDIINLAAGSYTVTVTDNNGDSEQFTVTVTDYVPPVTFDVVPNVCIDGGLVSLDSDASPTPGNNETGVFTGTGVSNTTFDPATAEIGTHTLTYTFTDEHGCTNFATDQIAVNPTTTISVNSSSICAGESTTLTASGTSSYT